MLVYFPVKFYFLSYGFIVILKVIRYKNNEVLGSINESEF